MISQIHIKNFKSIVDLTLDLGRVNLFIGENGSGKSNILEAVAFATSAKEGEINNSVLVSKGARIAKDELYIAAFSDNSQDIELSFVIDNNLIEKSFLYAIGKWTDINVAKSLSKLIDFVLHCMGHINDEHFQSTIAGNIVPFEQIPYKFYIDKLDPKTPTEIVSRLKTEGLHLENYFKYSANNYLLDYLIFSPEVSYLRKFEEEGQVKPLGTRGEGLFSLIKSMASDNGSLQHIKVHLEAIDWFEDFSIPNDLMSNEYKIAIKDRFINSELKYLDQRSANEGFLFLLFYVVLFSSKKTPQFFAIDNIEASFNPKLCSKLINTIVELSKKNEKQVLMTTHNPATLDGLDLNDPEQRLFVVRRNIDGHTIATRISEKPKISAPMKLSEMWTKGLLGGLPDNF